MIVAMLRPHVHQKPAFRHLPGTLLLVLALLWAQLLGLAHGVRHALPVPQQEAVHASVGASDLLGHFQAAPGEKSECRLYDQLGHGGPQLQLPAQPTAVPPLWVTWIVLVTWPAQACAFFAARAPPPSR